MRKRILKTVLVMTLILSLVMSCMTVSFAASKTKSMIVYDQVIKKDNIVYCCDGYSIFRVSLKTGKVKRLTSKDPVGVGEMRLYGNYVYYLSYSDGTVASINRVKKTGGSSKWLSSGEELQGYVISKNKIYYRYMDYDDSGDEYYVTKVMSLSGKNEKTSSYRIKNTYKKTNAKGYSVVCVKTKNYSEEKGKGYKTYYLKKPNGKKIKLEKITGKYLYNFWYGDGCVDCGY